MVVAVICRICKSFQYTYHQLKYNVTPDFIFFLFENAQEMLNFCLFALLRKQSIYQWIWMKASCYCFTSAEENRGFISYIKLGESDCIWHLSCVTNGFVKYYLHSIMVICLLGGCNKRITFLFNGYNSSFQYTEYFIPQQGINRMSTLKLHLFSKSSTNNSFLCLLISNSQTESVGLHF